MGYPAEFKPIVRDFYKDLKPLQVSAPPDAVFQQALALAREQPRWQVTAVDPQARTFEGVVETRLFRFRDDFVVRVRPDGEGARVDMRSKSRVGKGDLGANAQRIEQFLQALAARVVAGAEKAAAGIKEDSWPSTSSSRSWWYRSWSCTSSLASAGRLGVLPTLAWSSRQG